MADTGADVAVSYHSQYNRPVAYCILLLFNNFRKVTDMSSTNIYIHPVLDMPVTFSLEIDPKEATLIT